MARVGLHQRNSLHRFLCVGSLRAMLSARSCRYCTQYPEGMHAFHEGFLIVFACFSYIVGNSVTVDYLVQFALVPLLGALLKPWIAFPISAVLALLRTGLRTFLRAQVFCELSNGGQRPQRVEASVLQGRCGRRSGQDVRRPLDECSCPCFALGAS